MKRANSYKGHKNMNFLHRQTTGNIEENPFSSQLYVMVENSPVSLPSWAAGLVALGEHIAALDPGHPPVTVALELPTRRYAALFIALGVIYARQTRSDFTQKDFDGLAASAEPVKLRYRYQSVAYDGELAGCQIIDGEPHLVIKRLNEEKHYLPRSLSSQIIAISTDETLRLRHRELTFASNKNRNQGSLASQVFSGVDAADYLLSDRQDVVLFGPVGPLHHEAELPLALRDNDGNLSVGTLNEVVRVRDWRDQGSVNALLFPVSSEGEELPRELQIAPVAVFDGGLGYANWRYLIPGHHVALLTPGRTGFVQGDAALSEASLSRAGDHVLPTEVLRAFGSRQQISFTRYP